MASSEDARIAALAQQLLRCKRGSDIIAFRQRLTKAEAQAVIRHPSISTIDRAAILLAVQFQGDKRIRDRFHWSPDWGFGDSAILPGPEADQPPE